MNDIPWYEIAGNYVKSEYLYFGWALLVSYLLVWLIARWLANRSVGSNATIVSICHSSWAWAFLLHLVATISLAFVWVRQNGEFDAFWVFFAPYIIFAVLDLLGVVVQFSKAGSTTSYIK
ncbi:MAG: hypothetical protein NTY46_16905 [Candidatus Sumerlaeota bacterium]|nr:hypothetical protein [Candidatus Sumerlaeota bacterium]